MSTSGRPAAAMAGAGATARARIRHWPPSSRGAAAARSPPAVNVRLRVYAYSCGNIKTTALRVLFCFDLRRQL
ncbi:unnamed protein product, partial [Brenthis ino]